MTLIVGAIGQKAFDAAFARGRAMTIDEGVAFAVADKQPPKPVPPLSPPRIPPSPPGSWK